jgi:hypothetical protein
MAEGAWRWDHLGNYLPVYPAFLALQQILFGSDPLIGKVIHALMGSLSAVLMAQTAARAWNRFVQAWLFGGSALAPQALHGQAQAGLHPLDRLGQQTDFVF